MTKGEIQRGEKGQYQCNYHKAGEGKGSKGACIWCKRIKRIMQNEMPKVKRS